MTCADGLLYLSLNKTCLTSCPVEYYKDSTDCTLCYEATKKCRHCEETDHTKCLACKTEMFLHAKECLVNCPNTHYEIKEG